MPSRSSTPSPAALAQRSRRAAIKQAKLSAGWRDGRYRDPSKAPAPPYLAVQRWRLTHRDDARYMDRVYKGMKRNPIFVHAWPLIVAHYGGGCVCCGAVSVSADHVQPVMQSPLERNILHNLQPLCRRCNGMKRGRSEDYRPDGGAWILATFCDNAKRTLHPTRQRARYGSNGWAIVAPDPGP